MVRVDVHPAGALDLACAGGDPVWRGQHCSFYLRLQLPSRVLWSLCGKRLGRKHHSPLVHRRHVAPGGRGHVSGAKPALGRDGVGPCADRHHSHSGGVLQIRRAHPDPEQTRCGHAAGQRSVESEESETAGEGGGRPSGDPRGQRRANLYRVRAVTSG